MCHTFEHFVKWSKSKFLFYMFVYKFGEAAFVSNELKFDYIDKSFSNHLSIESQSEWFCWCWCNDQFDYSDLSGQYVTSNMVKSKPTTSFSYSDSNWVANVQMCKCCMTWISITSKIPSHSDCNWDAHIQVLYGLRLFRLKNSSPRWL